MCRGAVKIRVPLLRRVVSVPVALGQRIAKVAAISCQTCGVLEVGQTNPLRGEGLLNISPLRAERLEISMLELGAHVDLPVAVDELKVKRGVAIGTQHHFEGIRTGLTKLGDMRRDRDAQFVDGGRGGNNCRCIG